MEDGVDTVRGRMSGLGIRRTPRVEANSGQNSGDFVDGNWGKDGEKLDLPATHEIRGSNPTKLHHTNKSQKNLGLFLVGIFRNWGRTQQNQAKKQRGEAPKS